MNSDWLRRIRMLHTCLAVFFSPLLLLFIVTGWWQTFVTEDTRKHGALNKLMSRFSTIHTDDYFTRTAGHVHASAHFKLFVGCMAATLIFTLLLGLVLAAQKWTIRWTALGFFLGILIPALALYFN